MTKHERTLHHARHRIILAVLVGVAPACSSNEVIAPRATEIITLSPEALALAVGDSTVLRASALDLANRPLRSRFVFSPPANGVVRVRATSDSTAVITAVAPGNGEVLAQFVGGDTKTAPVTVRTR